MALSVFRDGGVFDLIFVSVIVGTKSVGHAIYWDCTVFCGSNIDCILSCVYVYYYYIHNKRNVTMAVV